MTESWSKEPRYRVQLVDRDRSVVIIDSTLIGRNVAMDLIRSCLDRHDLAGSLELIVHQLTSTT